MKGLKNMGKFVGKIVDMHRANIADEVKIVLDFYIQRYKNSGVDLQFMLDQTPEIDSKQYILEHWN